MTSHDIMVLCISPWDRLVWVPNMVLLILVANIVTFKPMYNIYSMMILKIYILLFRGVRPLYHQRGFSTLSGQACCPTQVCRAAFIWLPHLEPHHWHCASATLVKNTCDSDASAGVLSFNNIMIGVSFLEITSCKIVETYLYRDYIHIMFIQHIYIWDRTSPRKACGCPMVVPIMFRF